MISIWLLLWEQKIAEMMLMKCSLTYMPLKISQLFASFFSFFFSLTFPPEHRLDMLYPGMFSRREGRKCSPVWKSLHQDCDTGEDFPEQTAISPIFHAYGPECSALPYLNVNKTGISWPQFSLEDKKGIKASSKIRCVSCWLAHVSWVTVLAFSFLHLDARGRHHRQVPQDNVSVTEGPQIQWWSPKVIMELKNSYRLMTS